MSYPSLFASAGNEINDNDMSVGSAGAGIPRLTAHPRRRVNRKTKRKMRGSGSTKKKECYCGSKCKSCDKYKCKSGKSCECPPGCGSKSIRRKSIRRKSIKRKSIRRKSIRRKSIRRKSNRKYRGGMDGASAATQAAEDDDMRLQAALDLSLAHTPKPVAMAPAPLPAAGGGGAAAGGGAPRPPGMPTDLKKKIGVDAAAEPGQGDSMAAEEEEIGEDQFDPTEVFDKNVGAWHTQTLGLTADIGWTERLRAKKGLGVSPARHERLRPVALTHPDNLDEPKLTGYLSRLDRTRDRRPTWLGGDDGWTKLYVVLFKDRLIFAINPTTVWRGKSSIDQIHMLVHPRDHTSEEVEALMLERDAKTYMLADIKRIYLGDDGVLGPANYIHLEFHPGVRPEGPSIQLKAETYALATRWKKEIGEADAADADVVAGGRAPASEGAKGGLRKPHAIPGAAAREKMGVGGGHGRREASDGPGGAKGRRRRRGRRRGRR